MNSNMFESQWNQIKELIILKWNKLTEDDLRQIGGRFDQFIAKLQQRYGYTREEAEDEVRNWKPSLRAESTVRTESESGTPKWLPWLLVGIPLLFLLGYFGNREAEKPATVPVMPRTTQETYVDQRSVASDTITSQTLRNALAGLEQFRGSLDAIRIEADNGVVTIRGFVSTEQQKDLISVVASRIPGVKQVNNMVEVRQ